MHICAQFECFKYLVEKVQKFVFYCIFYNSVYNKTTLILLTICNVYIFPPPFKGRHGKGNIFMWASGNGGAHHDSCACDGYTNSIYTLSVSSASETNHHPWYLEECASTLATTYSSGANVGEKQVSHDITTYSCTLNAVNRMVR